MPMPVGAKSALERLRASHTTFTALKNSPIVIVQNTFEALVGKRLPWRVTQQVAYDSFVRHTFVFSNVPVRGLRLYRRWRLGETRPTDCDSITSSHAHAFSSLTGAGPAGDAGGQGRAGVRKNKRKRRKGDGWALT